MIKDIQKVAKQYEWIQITIQKNIGMISFKKDEIRINVYVTKMTVATCLNHPKKGKTQLFRRAVSLKDLEKIFKNPRTHTGKGYYTK